jgi:hypothetical protein
MNVALALTTVHRDVTTPSAALSVSVLMASKWTMKATVSLILCASTKTVPTATAMFQMA